MEKNKLKKIIDQLVKYDLLHEFSTEEEITKWLRSLNDRQINNFINLDIDKYKEKAIDAIVLDLNLLDSDDYRQRIDKILTLKVPDEYLFMLRDLTQSGFLCSEHFYVDIDLLKEAGHMEYGLKALTKPEFVTSQHHEKDMKLLTKTHDVNKNNPNDEIVLSSLQIVATNQASIESKFHEADMMLISESGSEALKSLYLVNLAIKEASLNDEFHYDNMLTLARNGENDDYLWKFISDEESIKRPHYFEEISSVKSAIDRRNAKALYYYIKNPNNIFTRDQTFFTNREGKESEEYFEKAFGEPGTLFVYVKGENDPDYLENLKSISTLNPDVVMEYTSLLMLPSFIKSKNKKFDLELLRQNQTSPTFIPLWKVMKNNNFLNSPHHQEDAKTIANKKLSHDEVEDLLLRVVTSKKSIESINHEFDINFVKNLDIKYDQLQENPNFDFIIEEIKYYLFLDEDATDEEHKKCLAELMSGRVPKKEDRILNYIKSLQEQIEEGKQEIDLNPKATNTPLKNKTIKQKIKEIFNK